MKIEEIAPVWSRRIARGYFTMHDVDLLSDCRSCIVGEGWKHSDKYIGRCKKCDDLAFELYHGISDQILTFEQCIDKKYKISLNSVFKEHLKDFETHWCETHSIK